LSFAQVVFLCETLGEFSTKSISKNAPAEGGQPPRQERFL